MVGKRFDVRREGELGEDAGGEFGLNAVLGLTLGGYGEFTFLPTLSAPFPFCLNWCCRSGLHVQAASHRTTNIRISF